MTIAKLNDLAYREIRASKKKRINKRMQQNKGIFEANDRKLQKLTTKLEFGVLRQQHERLINEIGYCPMSQCDVIEAMQDGDCMCLGLQIERSEATISDPSKLVVKSISPTFITLDSFLHSSIFNLNKDLHASGGFDYNQQSKLALGVANDAISGVLPLYLFKEHKEIVKLKQGPLYGFMCCLDPMGFEPS